MQRKFGQTNPLFDDIIIIVNNNQMIVIVEIIEIGDDFKYRCCVYIIILNEMKSIYNFKRRRRKTKQSKKSENFDFNVVV